MAQRAKFLARYGPWAVVTGASSGIGAEFARQLAERGLSLVLVARRREKLEALGAELYATHGTDVRVVPCDLADEDGAAHLIDEVADLDVGLLINNAGVGLKGRLVDIDPGVLRRLVEVNCQAPLALAHGFGRRLVARKRGGMVIVASTGGFQALPWSAAYGARTKPTSARTTAIAPARLLRPPYASERKPRSATSNGWPSTPSTS